MEFDDEEFIEVDGSVVFIEEPWEQAGGSIKSFFPWREPDLIPVCISISGAAGTGKKVLAKKLGTALDVPTIKGLARTANRYGAELDQDSNWEDIYMILMAQVWQEREFDEYVTAGSLIDILAHAHWYAHIAGGNKDMTMLRQMVNFVGSLVGVHYSVFVFVPYQTNPKKDGVRSTDHQYNMAIDRLIEHYLNLFDIDYFPLQGKPGKKYELTLGYLDHFGIGS